MHTTTHQLCPPGLVFGCAGETLVGQHLTHPLPTAPSRVGDLLKDPSIVNVKGALKVWCGAVWYGELW